MASRPPLAWLCRDCFADGLADPPRQCPACESLRLVSHAELRQLGLAHLDCDAFYASVEKRDNPSLAEKPVIIGGGKRGVVATACYVARIHGVRSAMPMFQAMKLCPDAVVIAPRMGAYQEAARQIRALMDGLTPLVEPLSIDEAFMDLAGTEKLHGNYPAASVAGLANRIEGEVGVSVSIGLASNKSLAKLASDMDKPRGFRVIGMAEAAALLSPMSVTTLFGVGKALARKMNRVGIKTCGDVVAADAELIRSLAGSFTQQLIEMAKGIDRRQVVANREAKSISAETTFEADIADYEILLGWLDRLCDRVVRRLRRNGVAGGRVVLKLKSAQHKLITRSATLPQPTRLKALVFAVSKSLLKRECSRTKYWRLIGIGVDQLTSDRLADQPNLADPDIGRQRRLQDAVDTIRHRHGEGSISSGRGVSETD